MVGFCIYFWNLSIVRNGADVNIIDKEGKTPLDCASNNGFHRIVEYLSRPAVSSMSTNKSNLSEKLRLGFGDSRRSANPENPGTNIKSYIKRETGSEMFLPPGSLTLSSSSPSTLVSKSSHSGMDNYIKESTDWSCYFQKSIWFPKQSANDLPQKDSWCISIKKKSKNQKQPSSPYRRATIIEKVKLLLTFYRPLPTHPFFTQ